MVNDSGHVLVTEVGRNVPVCVGDRILAANNCVVDPDQIVKLLAMGSGPLNVDVLRPPPEGTDRFSMP